MTSGLHRAGAQWQRSWAGASQGPRLPVGWGRLLPGLGRRGSERTGSATAGGAASRGCWTEKLSPSPHGLLAQILPCQESRKRQQDFGPSSVSQSQRRQPDTSPRSTSEEPPLSPAPLTLQAGVKASWAGSGEPPGLGRKPPVTGQNKTCPSGL